jgi:methylated-DNA-[protein]-cysteine S-methyltransferase
VVPLSEVIVVDLRLPTGPLAVGVDRGEVVWVTTASAGVGRPADAAEEESFALQLLGRGRFVYPCRWDGVGPFHRQVLERLLTIPPGETRSYGWLAAAVGRPRAARAVGAAMARNPFPVLYPCHRVVPADGSLGQYGFGGPAMKARLLAWEAAEQRG